MTKLITLLLMALTATSFVYSSTDYSRPEKCPSVDAIQLVGVSDLLWKDDSHWDVQAPGKNAYNTPQAWGFFLQRVQGANEMAALQKAKSTLPTLHYESGPTYNMMGLWICYYTTAAGYAAFAATPLQ